ncbi:MMPL family transporter [Sulfobacillus harzensis]|uniref:MMPL family transporter n=1 Tax=Sulfobacillus harzensis TaxID=2729629 RepID=A0A7Y0L4E6_9FIRM|nr:MMPL family transporter [Sulfobacillus harzensis]NMP21684.1 MMPL family transporter [Sulfobacillus harzensis]
MSTFLYRVGQQAYRNPWRFIVGWVVILGILATLLGVNGVHISNNMTIQGTEAQQVLDRLHRAMPKLSGGQGSVVFTAPKRERLDTPQRLAALARVVRRVDHLHDVVNPAKGTPSAQNTAKPERSLSRTAAFGGHRARYGPLMDHGVPIPGVIVSSNGRVALFQFQFTVPNTSVSSTLLSTIVRDAKSAQHGTGITVLPTYSLQQQVPQEGSTDLIGLGVAAIVLLVTLGSVVAAGLPILIALAGVGVGVGGALAFSKFFPVVNITPVLALMIGLAVGIDYSLFIVNRQRRLMINHGLNAQEALGRAVGTAGTAVLFSGSTVVIALCAMVVMGIQFMSVMALVAAATVAITVLLALTLLPALLGLIGERIRGRAQGTKQNQSRPRWAHKWVHGVITGRWLVIVGVVVLLGAAAIPSTKMKLGFPSGATANLNTASRQSYDAISSAFGPGFNGPLLVVAQPRGSSQKITPTVLSRLVLGVQKVGDVSLVAPMGISTHGTLAVLSVIPKSGPNAQATINLVKHLRSRGLRVAANNHLALGVTGMTALNIDMSAKLAHVFPIYVSIIVILSFLILLLVFRSIMVPLKATVGFLLGILATFGMSTAVFQWGWFHAALGFDTGGPLLSFLPILVTGILYGLAMDYEMFLVSSMRESHVHGHRGTASVIDGYDQASRVVVAAATIMVSVFAGFIFSPNIEIKQIGFALALGILIDAFIIRLTLVPAVMALLGDKSWWIPQWLHRRLPNLDVEGDTLVAALRAQDGEPGAISNQTRALILAVAAAWSARHGARPGATLEEEERLKKALELVRTILARGDNTTPEAAPE